MSPTYSARTKTGCRTSRSTCSPKMAAFGSTVSARTGCPPSPKTASTTCARSSPINEPPERRRPRSRRSSLPCGPHRMLTERIHHALYVEAREREGREASPTAAIIDSQRAKAAQKGAPRLTRKGLMRARRSPGRKRHILVDTLGLLLNVVVHPGDVQDRDGARLV